MKRTVLTLLLLGMLTSPAFATTGPGKGNKTKYGRLEVVNTCDAAIEVNITDGETVPATAVLEPSESRLFYFVVKGKRLNLQITASLPGTTITSSATCTVESNKTTLATISCDTSNPPVLSIECLNPGETLAALDVRRETGVLVASSGGLGLLLVFAMLLGRAPKQPEMKSEGKTIELA